MFKHETADSRQKQKNKDGQVMLGCMPTFLVRFRLLTDNWYFLPIWYMVIWLQVYISFTFGHELVIAVLKVLPVQINIQCNVYSATLKSTQFHTNQFQMLRYSCCFFIPIMLCIGCLLVYSSPTFISKTEKYLHLLFRQHNMQIRYSWYLAV